MSIATFGCVILGACLGISIIINVIMGAVISSKKKGSVAHDVNQLEKLDKKENAIEKKKRKAYEKINKSTTDEVIDITNSHKLR